MPRRVSLPGASELFRPTRSADPEEVSPADEPAASAPAPAASGATGQAVGRGTGRVRHEEKITVYVSRDELLALEQARLTLRRLGLAVDRGRVVREALALALGDLEAHGEDALLVRRLTAGGEPSDAGPDTSA